MADEVFCRLVERNQVRDATESQNKVKTKLIYVLLSILTTEALQRAKELALAYIIDTDQPFSTFSNKYIKELLNLFDQGLAGQLALGRTSFREDLSKLFEKKKAEIKADLRDALSIVHLSFDL